MDKKQSNKDDKRQLYPAIRAGDAIGAFDPNKATLIASKPTDTRLGTRDWSIYQLNKSKGIVLLRDEVANILSKEEATEFIIRQIHDLGATEAIELLIKLGINCSVETVE